MPIHDLGYREWEGMARRTPTRWAVIAETGIRLAWKSYWLRRMMFVSWLPAVALGVFLFAFERAMTEPEARTIVGVVANRIRSNTIAYRKLKNFLNTLRIPIISELKDSQAYLHANDQGKALFELTRRSKEEIEKWDHFGHWIQRRRKRKADLSTV